MSNNAMGGLMAATDSALIVVTTAVGDERAGCLVGFHTQSSISPQHYCLWLSKANHTYRMSLRASYFAVHFLTAQDLAMAKWFGTQTGEDTDKFSGIGIDDDETGIPLVRACPNRMVLERISMLDDGGDHVCITTRVRSAQNEGPFLPLRLSDAEHLTPGHGSEERAIQP